MYQLVFCSWVGKFSCMWWKLERLWTNDLDTEIKGTEWISPFIHKLSKSAKRLWRIRRFGCITLLQCSETRCTIYHCTVHANCSEFLHWYIILKRKCKLGMCNGILNTEEGLYTQNVYFFKTFDTFWELLEYHPISYQLKVSRVHTFSVQCLFTIQGASR